MDLSGIEEFPIGIQISPGKKEISPIPPPNLKFLIYGPIFMKLGI